MNLLNENHPRFRFVAAMIIGTALTGGVWAVSSLFTEEEKGPVPVVHADASPYKSQPNDPGGMKVPNQDKLVFNTVAPDGKVVTVERLLPPSEQPLARGEAPAQSPLPAAAANTNAPNAAGTTATAPTALTVSPSQEVAAMGRAIEPPPETPTEQPLKKAEKPPSVAVPTMDTPAAFEVAKAAAAAEKKKQKITAAKKPAARAVQTRPLETKNGEAKTAEDKTVKTRAVDASTEDKVSEPVPLLAQEEAQGPQPSDGEASTQEENATPVLPPRDEVQKDTNNNEVEEPAPVKAAASGLFRFQLASFTDRPSASRAVGTLSKRYSSAIGGAPLFVTEATISKGRVYRVQGKAARDDANRICQGVKALGGACVILRP